MFTEIKFEMELAKKFIGSMLTFNRNCDRFAVVRLRLGAGAARAMLDVYLLDLLACHLFRWLLNGFGLFLFHRLLGHLSDLLDRLLLHRDLFDRLLFHRLCGGERWTERVRLVHLKHFDFRAKEFWILVTRRAAESSWTVD